jgi:hypothetical protein
MLFGWVVKQDTLGNYVLLSLIEIAYAENRNGVDYALGEKGKEYYTNNNSKHALNLKVLMNQISDCRDYSYQE